MTPKDKTIIQIIIDTIGTLILTIVMLGLPVLFVVSRYEKCNDEVSFIIAIFCLLDIAAVFNLIDANK